MRRTGSDHGRSVVEPELQGDAEMAALRASTVVLPVDLVDQNGVVLLAGDRGNVDLPPERRVVMRFSEENQSCKF